MALYLGGAEPDTLDPILVACMADYREHLDEDGQVAFKGRAKAFLRANGFAREPEPELDLLSNILETFNDQSGDIPWSDADRVHRLITEDIPSRVAADTAYQNARRNSDRQNARIEHDKALTRVMTAVLKDDTELFKQFMDNESFKRWLTDTVFGLTYEPAGQTR